MGGGVHGTPNAGVAGVTSLVGTGVGGAGGAAAANVEHRHDWYVLFEELFGVNAQPELWVACRTQGCRIARKLR